MKCYSENNDLSADVTHEHFEMTRYICYSSCNHWKRVYVCDIGTQSAKLLVVYFSLTFHSVG